VFFLFRFFHGTTIIVLTLPLALLQRSLSLVATRKIWDIDRANKRNIRLPRLPFGLHLPQNRHD
jgi:hypothetical protein